MKLRQCRLLRAKQQAQKYFYSKQIFCLNIFSTMTFNPEWAEISDTLLPGRSVIDLFCIAARFFLIKTRLLRAFVLDEQVFREAKAQLVVIEIQLVYDQTLFFVKESNNSNP